MKKLTTALCAVLLMILVLMPGAAAAGPALSATRAYCIIDADTGLVLAQQNMNEELHPASITKVMTLALACEKAQGSWDGVKLTVSHEDVYSLAGTDSSHIALQEGEEVPLTDALYATQMASANDGANLLAEYFGGGTIADGVAKMNAQVRELGLAHTHFANPHGISGDDHYTSCYDMAQILRWALQQPGFETVFTRNEMYTMQPTNLQPVTRYFSQQDKMRIGSSRYHIDGILGSKLGYTNTARYSYACLAEQNGVRLICVTMQSELSTDKYNDVRTLLDYAFSTFTGYTDLPARGVTAQLPVVITVVKGEQEPRFETIRGRLHANRYEIKSLTRDELPVEDESIGLKGSATRVKRSFTPERHAECVWIKGESVREQAGKLYEALERANVI